jgi:hypothetical protein
MKKQCDQLNVLKAPPAMSVNAARLFYVRITEKGKLLWIIKKSLCVSARINRHVRDSCTFETTVEWSLGCGLAQSHISQWMAPLKI